MNREVRPRLAARVNIPVYAHVIKGKHRGERNPAGPRRVRALVATLNQGMAGGQSDLQHPAALPLLAQEDRLHEAATAGTTPTCSAPATRRPSARLHRGNARTLNLYINGGGPRGTPVLGWARFPWQYAEHPAAGQRDRQRRGDLRGGSARGYNLGDTVVHETGHWLGLYHTFEGGCSARGDLVAGHPGRGASRASGARAGATPAPPTRGSTRCGNFMDYSLDACMNRFSAGQVRRIDAAFVKWRQ